jgi:fructosamine-3-kinase
MLGRGLARLHRDAPERFGLDHDGWLATLPQSNRSHAAWPSFYAEERLLPLTERAAARGLLSTRLRDRLAALRDGMERRVGPPEPPARLHGDLWSGNVLSDERGHPCLIDPAVYGGHREVDLAMMRLFGGFSRAVFDAYAAEAPLAPGWERRVPLYQVWPLLAHVCLFGRSYVGRLAESVDAALDA